MVLDFILLQKWQVFPAPILIAIANCAAPE
jgi:hypothetical protein